MADMEKENILKKIGHLVPKEKENLFKKIFGVVPNGKDFVDSILCIIENMIKRSYHTCMPKDRFFYEKTIETTEMRISEKFSEAVDKFPSFSEVDPWYGNILNKRYSLHQYEHALCEVTFAGEMIEDISENYALLMEKDDCDSLEKCKSLQLTAFACMLTVAKRCIPSLTYLEKVVQFMANLEESDELAAAMANKYHRDVDCTVSQLVDVDNVADLVEPETLFLVEELDRRYGLRLNDNDDQQVECAKIAASRSLEALRA